MPQPTQPQTYSSVHYNFVLDVRQSYVLSLTRAPISNPASQKAKKNKNKKKLDEIEKQYFTTIHKQASEPLCKAL